MEPIQSADELQQLLNQAIADKTELEAELNSVKVQLSDTLEANGSLSAEIEKITKTASDSIIKKAEDAIGNLADHVFEFAGGKFGFNYPKLTLPNKQVITPVEVKASTELQQQLIASGSSMIKKL